MTLITKQIIVATTPTLLCNPSTSPQRVVVHNNATSQEIFVGPDGVTTLTGLHVDGKEEREFVLFPGQSLYGISAVPPSGSTVSIMIQTQT